MRLSVTLWPLQRGYYCDIPRIDILRIHRIENSFGANRGYNRAYYVSVKNCNHSNSFLTHFNPFLTHFKTHFKTHSKTS